MAYCGSCDRDSSGTPEQSEEYKRIARAEGIAIKLTYKLSNNGIARSRH